MERDRHKRIYDLHSWTGVALGMFLFIVCFSGSVAMFATDIARWEDPVKQLAMPETSAPIGPAFEAWATDKARTGKIETLFLDRPDAERPYYRGYVHLHLKAEGSDHNETMLWHPQALEPLAAREATISSWLAGFHRDFRWPEVLGGHRVGRFIVGLAGIVLLLSIVSGIVAHKKLKDEVFTLRLDRSVRLRWQDSHKVFGLWGLPFHIMIGLSGAALGIVTLLAPIAAVIAYKGDVEALFAAAQGQMIKPAGIEAQMLSVDTAFDMAYDRTGAQPISIRISHWGDQNAVYTVQSRPDAELLDRKPYQISGVTGKTIPLTPEQKAETPGTRVNGAFKPLHFGTFGGLALRFLWFGLGLSLAIITAFGTMMWIERRQHGYAGQRSDRFYNGISRLNSGICIGLAVATAGLFVQSIVYWGPEAGRTASIVWTYFGLWALSIAYAFVRDGLYNAPRELIALTGALLITAALLNQGLSIFTGSGLSLNSSTLVADLTLIGFGVIAIYVAKSLPKKRPTKERKRRTYGSVQDASAGRVPAE